MLLLLIACSPVEPSLTLGTGLTAFQPLEDGDEVALIYGPQGGWHVDVALRTTGIDADGLVLRTGAFLDGTPLAYPLESELREDWVLPLEDGWERLGDRVVFDIAADTDVLDSEVELWVSLTDREQSWSASRTVWIR